MRTLTAVLAIGAALSFTPVMHAATHSSDCAKVKRVEGKKHHGMHGTISSIDGSTVVVSSTNKKGETKDHKVKTDSSTKVMLDGKEVKVADLKPGFQVEITRGANKGDPAAEIDATSVAAAATTK